MLITRTSQLTGKTRELEVPCTEEQYKRYLAGEYIQRAMPNVPADLREFVKTGIVREEWDSMFSVFPEGDDGF